MLPAILLLLYAFAWGQPLLLHPYNTLTAGSLRQPDAGAWQLQPAMLAGHTRFTAGMFALRRYMLSELTHAGISAVVPMGRQALGISLQQVGGLYARQLEAALGFAQKLGGQASVGVQFHYQQYRAMGYGRQGSLGYTLSGRLQLAPQVQALASVSNPIALQGNSLQRLPARYDLGLGADLSDELFVGGALVLEADGSPSVQAGLQYRLLNKCFGRLGVFTGSGQWMVGGGYRLGAFRLEVYSLVHLRLGISPGIQLQYQPDSKQ